MWRAGTARKSTAKSCITGALTVKQRPWTKIVDTIAYSAPDTVIRLLKFMPVYPRDAGTKEPAWVIPRIDEPFVLNSRLGSLSCGQNRGYS